VPLEQFEHARLRLDPGSAPGKGDEPRTFSLEPFSAGVGDAQVKLG
jgi:hypothetical protein